MSGILSATQLIHLAGAGTGHVLGGRANGPLARTASCAPAQPFVHRGGRAA